MGAAIEKVIEVKHIKKIYHMGKERIPAVDDVSFEIEKGEFCCLLGTSGSGKSTLLNLMAGIEKASGGEILIKGKSIRKMTENKLAKFRQSYLGFVFQSYNLMNSMNALENVEFPLVFKRMRTKKRKLLARQMLIQVGLGARLNHKPKEMSGGQQQRVGIARAFVAKPEIVFADEPTGNLDTKTAMEVMHLIHGIARRNNQTIVMVTHDPRLAEYADKIIHILDGKIQSIEVRKTAELIAEERKQAVEEGIKEEAAYKEERKARREAARQKIKSGHHGEQDSIVTENYAAAEEPPDNLPNEEGIKDGSLHKTAAVKSEDMEPEAIDQIQIQSPKEAAVNKELQAALSKDVAVIDKKDSTNMQKEQEKGEENNEKE